MTPDAIAALAREIADAYAAPHAIAVPPTARDGGLTLDDAYHVEAAIVGLRRAAGHATSGLKVGYANRAMWRALKLETLVWAHMYDDTVERTGDDATSLELSSMWAPKIEPEIVFCLSRALTTTPSSPEEALAAVEWVALGFEIIDCVFPDWKVQPADFVAAKGLHARLIVGTPRAVDAASIPALVEQLASFTVGLDRDGARVADGGARNCLKSPALCLVELASAVGRRPDGATLDAGALVSSGTLTESQLLGPGQTWTATLTGLDLPPLTVRTTGSPRG